MSLSKRRRSAERKQRHIEFRRYPSAEREEWRGNSHRDWALPYRCPVCGQTRWVMPGDGIPRCGIHRVDLEGPR